jgi:hypothetical protein
MVGFYFINFYYLLWIPNYHFLKFSVSQIVQQMSEKVEFKDEVLPQDRYEGVDPNEWVNKKFV